MARPRMELDASALRAALERVSVPSYILDRSGQIRWLNESARSLVGNAVGRDFTEVVAPEHTVRAREMFVKKLFGAERTDFSVTLLHPSGRRIPVEVSSTPLEDREHHVVGVFGLATVPSAPERPAASRAPRLTRRQHEVLTQLAEGASTVQIGQQLGIAEDTVRNHVREILRRLGVHSRIAAVAAARRQGLI